MAEKILVDMKTHILTVATSLMTEKGIKQTSLNDIAKKAGISKGTLYYYSSAKEDIIYDIADRNLTQITNEMMDILNNAANISLKDVLLTLYNKVLEAETRGKLHLYLLNEVSTNEKLADKFKIRYSEWRESIQEGISKFNPNTGKNKILSLLILSSLDGLIVQKLCGYDAIPVNEIVDFIIEE